MVLGTRYPTLAFHTGGAGQAADGIPPQPFETFCYDSALMEAKIQDFNIVPYTSVLPKACFGNIVDVDQVKDQFVHGAVLEVIIAGNGARIEDHKAIATGVGICWGKDSKGELIGGWAAEYRLPLDFFRLFYPDFRLVPGIRFRGNCYKCGDRTEHPHFLAWNPVHTPTPDFHRPEFLGEMILS